MNANPEGGQHVAIIMDGNGRWALQRGLPGLRAIARGLPRCGAWLNGHLTSASLA